MIKLGNLKEHIGKEVEVQAFVDNVRNIKWVQFIVLRDLTGKVQVTIEKSLEENKEMVELVNELTIDSTVKIKGKLIENENYAKIKDYSKLRKHSDKKY